MLYVFRKGLCYSSYPPPSKKITMPLWISLHAYTIVKNPLVDAASPRIKNFLELYVPSEGLPKGITEKL
jgi:hypothetical protein